MVAGNRGGQAAPPLPPAACGESRTAPPDRRWHTAGMEPVPGLDLRAPPFDLLDADGQSRLSAALDLAFHPAGTLLVGAGQPSEHVQVIAKGEVVAFDRDDTGEQHFADFGPGDVFGAFAVITGRARHSYRARSDTLAWLLPAGVFRALLASQPRFAAWFHEGLAVKGALAGDRDGGELAALLVTRVGDAVLAPAHRLHAATSIAEASASLRTRRVDCLLVEDPDAEGLGIVTRTDLLDALTRGGLPVDAAIGPLASRPLRTVRVEDPLFQALVLMTEQHIERVVVVEAGRPVGTLGMAEVLAHYASHSHTISLRLARAHDLDAVADAARDMTRLVRQLHAQGARIAYLTELVSALNTRVMARLFELLVPAGLRDRVALLVLGSEGRREQILKTDQDNALLLADGLDWPDAAATMDRFSQALAGIGYPPCPGGVMASNPHWRLSVSDFVARIDDWRREPTGQAALDLAIALDARVVAGNAALFAPVRAALSALGRDEILLRSLAAPVLAFQPPLTLFGSLRHASAGLDLKKGALFPIVHGLRCLALRHGIEHRNSDDRIRALVERGALSAELGASLGQALAVVQRLRLARQLEAIDAGAAPDNLLHPEALRRIDRELLRDALRVVRDFQRWLAGSFHLAG